MTIVTKQDLETFVEKIQQKVAEYHLTNFPSLNVPIIELDGSGRKYMRIACTCVGQKTVICFIDLSDGDVIRADSWSTPSKRSKGRVGNIFDEHGGVSQFNGIGINYLRRG